MINMEEDYNTTPICPFCNTGLTSIKFRQLRTFLGKRFVYFCPHCSKVLGLSHRKGFWMG